MPFEVDDCRTAELANQLSIIEEDISSNPDCHVVVGGDFNVDMLWIWTQTSMLESFSTNLNLNIALRHEKCHTDNSYHFNKCRFNVLGQFLLSSTLYNKSIDDIHVLHDANNLSDHEPIV